MRKSDTISNCADVEAENKNQEAPKRDAALVPTTSKWRVKTAVSDVFRAKIGGKEKCINWNPCSMIPGVC